MPVILLFRCIKVYAKDQGNSHSDSEVFIFISYSTDSIEYLQTVVTKTVIAQNMYIIRIYKKAQLTQREARDSLGI